MEEPAVAPALFPADALRHLGVPVIEVRHDAPRRRAVANVSCDGRRTRAASIAHFASLARVVTIDLRLSIDDVSDGDFRAQTRDGGPDPLLFVQQLS